MLSNDFGLRERGGRIQVTGQSASSNLNNFGPSSIFTGLYADTASLASPVYPGSREFTSHILCASTCAEEPCSVSAA